MVSHLTHSVVWWFLLLDQNLFGLLTANRVVAAKDAIDSSVKSRRIQSSNFRRNAAVSTGYNHGNEPWKLLRHPLENVISASAKLRGGSKDVSSVIPTSPNAALTPLSQVAEPALSKATTPQRHERRKQIPRRPQQSLVQMHRTRQSLLRRQFWALLVLRFGFLLLAPVSLLALLVLFVAGTVVHATFLLTFTVFAGQSRLILTTLTKAALAVVLASVCGTLLPVFAAFGLVISVLQCGLELTEPILRIRYQRQLRKIRHLHTLLTDPVLVETLQGLIRGAGAVTAATQRSLASSAKYSQRQLANMAASGYVAASSLVSTEMVEQLVTEISANSQFLTELQRKTPPAVWKWTQQQYISLKESGLLEAAAKQAIQALQGELEAAADFLPYLNAIEKVRQEQQERLARQLAGTREKKNGWFRQSQRP